MKNSAFVLLSIGLVIISWGAYGNLLNAGTRAMGSPTDPAIGVSHFLPFIFVGVAYFLIAVLAAWGYLRSRGEPGHWSAAGIFWSFLAGVFTAIGALGVILAMTSGGSPIYVMPLIFGGAPVVNTIVSMLMAKSFREAGPMFYAGLVLVILGAVAVLVWSPAAQNARELPSFLTFMKVFGFVLLTAVCWGCYGPLLHKGQMQMQGSRMRPFICVGMAYVVVAVALPLLLRNDGGSGPADVLGHGLEPCGRRSRALGSLGVILAFTYGGKPIYVMPLVFGGAPVVNTFISIATLLTISPLFYAGLILVVAGAIIVLVFAPKTKPTADAEPAEKKPAPSLAPSHTATT